jgi:hypothetical protein
MSGVKKLELANPVPDGVHWRHFPHPAALATIGFFRHELPQIPATTYRHGF